MAIFFFDTMAVETQRQISFFVSLLKRQSQSVSYLMFIPHASIHIDYTHANYQGQATLVPFPISKLSGKSSLCLVHSLEKNLHFKSFLFHALFFHN